MTGKEKCEFLKGIRKKIAEANGIAYEPRECDHGDECSGTCPVCELEAVQLLAELKKKRAEIPIDKDAIETLEKISNERISFLNILDYSPTGGYCPNIVTDGVVAKEDISEWVPIVETGDVDNFPTGITYTETGTMFLEPVVSDSEGKIPMPIDEETLKKLQEIRIPNIKEDEEL